MGKVWVLGSINLDTTYMVDELPCEGVTILAEESFSMMGGKGLNQACAASRAGAEVALIGALGKDTNASVIKEEIKEYGVDITHVVFLEKARTGTAVILVDKNGRNLIVVNSGANKQVHKTAIALKKGDILTAQMETNVDAIVYYFKLAKQAGALTVLNPSPYSEEVSEILPYTDLLVANEHETGMILHKKVHTKEEVLTIEQKGLLDMIITMGKEGVAICRGGKNVFIEGHKAKTVDTQGAGDAFLGVLLSELAKGSDMIDAAGFANLIAARCVEHKGSTLASLPSKEEIEQKRMKFYERDKIR